MDKPPLLFYSQALFYPLFGPVEWAARLPSLLASLLLIPLTAQLARRLGGDRVAAFVAAAVVAVAPLAVQFSATAFSDPLLTFWLTAAVVLLMPSPNPSRREGDQALSPIRREFSSGPSRRERDRVSSPLGRGSWQPLWVGLCLGLALATKYQAVFFLPLLVGLAWLRGWRAREWARGLAGLLAVLAVVLLWAAARTDGAGFVARQWANVGGLRLAWSWELGPRLAEQGRLWWLGLGGPLLALGGVALAGVVVSRRARARLSAADALLALFVIAYALLHWLWAVPAWDRYLLPVLPIAAALLGRAVAAIAGLKLGPAITGLLIVVAVLHLPVAANARAGRYPIGGQPAADGGAAGVARALADAPYGTVLYDHWYSWHWRYQLFDARVYVSWFPHADALLADLAAFGGSGPARYVALPSDGSAAPVVRRLGETGYRLVAVAGPAEAAIGLWRIESEATDE